jgi:hypothetical protein
MPKTRLIGDERAGSVHGLTPGRLWQTRSNTSGRTTAARSASSTSGTASVTEKVPWSARKTPNFR